MSTLAKIIYEETGLTQSGTPGEYEEIASACRRFALHCDPRQPLTTEMAELGWKLYGSSDAYQTWHMAVEWTERAHGICE